ncbi:RES domain-containing protein [Georgenia satyanarayanai]|uniref:RES domain-containing protein n=1 Tax=Georgenia satyanarayanai TaxID=860221 RepID=UPI000DA130DC|nr:RES domain-containing protein [Georgenia satyanarayanai]
MTPTLDEELVQRVNDLGPTPWSGTTYRHVAGQRDPLSGAGARIFGGRWNPPGVFGAIYLAHPVAACMAELARMASSQDLTVSDFLRARGGRTLHTIDVRELSVLDLRTEAAQAQVGLELTDITDEDRTACQAVGHAAHFLGLGGVLTPSATGVGLVLTAFESRVGPGQLRVEHSELITDELYAGLV